MVVERKKINILPDRSLMPKIGQTGYSVSQAIAELVDNSIDAILPDKLLVVEVTLDRKSDTILVSDNGVGMNEETAINSMRLAHSSKKNMLGEFGLGLKTASTCLGKSFRITTTQKDDVKEYAIEYDEEKWLKSGSWTEHEIKINKIDKNKSGTRIEIKNLNCKIYPNLPGNVRKDLATRFAPFIETGEVKIRVNTKWCNPEPLNLNTNYCPPNGKEQFSEKLESGNKVYGWRGLLTKGSDKGDYGFRVFRRGRLVKQFVKLGFNPHPEARQIIGEIHLDHVPITHNKREFIQESLLYKEIAVENGIFWKFMRSIVREARSNSRKTDISQGIIDKIEQEKENILKAIKNISQLKEYAFPDLNEKNRANKEHHDSFGDVETEQRDEREIVTIVDEPKNKDKNDRNPKKTHHKKTYYITIKGKKFEVQHHYVDLKTDDVLKDKIVDEENGIQVFTNTAFPAFANTKDHVFYGVWHIAESIAEVMVELNNKPTEQVAIIRDLILKKSAQIARDLDNMEKEKKLADKLKTEYEEKMANVEQMEEQLSK